jgi:hypothetical protein
VQWQLQEQEIGREVSFIFGTTRQRLCCKMISLAGARDSMSFPSMTDVVYTVDRLPPFFHPLLHR